MFCVSLGKDDDRNAKLTRGTTRGAGDSRTSAEVPGRHDQPAGAPAPARRVHRKRDYGRRGRPDVRRRQQQERLQGAQARHVRGDAHAEGPKAPTGKPLPGWPPDSLPESGQGPYRGRGGDVCHGHQYEEGAKDRPEDGHRPPPRRPGGLYGEGSGCRCRGAALKGPLGNKDALSLAGRHLCEARKGRACGSCGRK